MATPPHFSPIRFGPRGRQQTFKGGPRGANNPTRELLKEASAIFGKEKLVAQVVSLGCGCSHISSAQTDSDTEGVNRSVQEMALDCEAVAKELSTRLCDMEEYLRLNVDRGMENLAMNDWDDLGPIETHTSAYVERAEISETIEASLRRLQGITGSVTLGEISAYFCILNSLKLPVTDDRQITQGRPRTWKTGSISKRRSWHVLLGVLKTPVSHDPASHQTHVTSLLTCRHR
jgi:hypothetical protein